ncbi:MAG TPA: imelysin family protein [Kofleriaceae bacterium]|nr:imelysin family protein [Kofleriaceae bacterium]
MTRRAKRRLGLALAGLVTSAAIVAIVLVACVVPLGDGTRRIVAGELAAEIIVPTYDEVVDRTAMLATAAHAFVTSPDADTLAALQAAWRAARVPWKQTDAFRFGPTAMQSLATAIDQVPVDPTKIEAELAGTATLDAAYVANLGANKKGFHTIEYFVFGSDPAAVLASLTTDAQAPRRRDYLAACADELAATAVRLRDAWVGYAAQLADPGADNIEYPTIKASIDALVNESVFQAEVVADARIGKPMGTATGGTPKPELQESAPSENSIADMTQTLTGIRNIYYGTRTGEPGKGIGSLVAAASPATDRDVRTALDAAFSAVAAIPTPYTQALLDERPEVMAAYTAVQELQRVLATEVIATLGATLKFNDNDGD